MYRRQSEGNETIMLISVLSLTDLYTFFFCHSGVNGNPEAMVLDSCFRRNDKE